MLAGGTSESGLTSPAWLGIQSRLGVRAEVVAPGSAVDPGLADAVTPALGAVLSLWAKA